MAVTSAETRFLFIVFLNSYAIIGVFKIKFNEDLSVN